jgi:hypothetical protein
MHHHTDPHCTITVRIITIATVCTIVIAPSLCAPSLSSAASPPYYHDDEDASVLRLLCCCGQYELICFFVW